MGKLFVVTVGAIAGSLIGFYVQDSIIKKIKVTPAALPLTTHLARPHMHHRQLQIAA